MRLTPLIGILCCAMLSACGNDAEVSAMQALNERAESLKAKYTYVKEVGSVAVLPAHAAKCAYSLWLLAKDDMANGDSEALTSLAADVLDGWWVSDSCTTFFEESDRAGTAAGPLLLTALDGILGESPTE